MERIYSDSAIMCLEKMMERQIEITVSDELLNELTPLSTTKNRKDVAKIVMTAAVINGTKMGLSELNVKSIHCGMDCIEYSLMNGETKCWFI